MEGTLPPGLCATVLRTGPGLMERFGRRLLHSFEADGALSGLRLHADGRAEVAVRVVESPGYLAEQAAGRPLFGSAAPWWRRVLNGLRGRDKATGNTSIMTWQGRTYALMEASRPLEIDPADLSTGATTDLGGVLGGTFSAHPHRLARQGVSINFGMHYGPRPHLRLYALPDHGRARVLGEVDLPWNAMVHDFAVTERYAVFVICPLQMSVPRAMLAPRDLGSLFRWKPAAGTEIIVVPLDDVEHPVRASADARFVFHLANAHHHGDDLVVDLVQYPSADVVTALAGEGGPVVDPSRLQRLVLDPVRGRVHADEPRWDRGCDFPVLPAERVGHDGGTLWLMISEDGVTGIARHDGRTGTVDAWETGPGFSASEPLFVPAPGASRDDEGWLVSLVLDGWRGESFFGIFDADRPSAGPLARVWMGQALPITFHGTVLPGPAAAS